MNTDVPTQDERIMAALSHISVILPFWGVLAPIIIWATQREKSAYVRFQSLQALAYQISMILAGVVGFACYMCSIFSIVAFVPLLAGAGERFDTAPPPAFFFIPAFPFLVFGAIFVGVLVFVLYGLAGAIMALQGKNFRYFIIGSQVERFLQRG